MGVVDGVQQGEQFDDMVAHGWSLGVEHHHDVVAYIVNLHFHVLIGKSADAMTAYFNTIVIGLVTKSLT